MEMKIIIIVTVCCFFTTALLLSRADFDSCETDDAGVVCVLDFSHFSDYGKSEFNNSESGSGQSRLLPLLHQSASAYNDTKCVYNQLLFNQSENKFSGHNRLGCSRSECRHYAWNQLKCRQFAFGSLSDNTSESDIHFCVQFRVCQVLHFMTGCEKYQISVDLSNDDLTCLGHTLFEIDCCARLVTLDLSHNNIDTLCPGILTPLTALRELDLSHNNLEQLPLDSLPPSLVVLNVSFNRIVQLNRHLFEGFCCLETLDMSHNNISYVQSGVFHPGMTSVMWANFSHNKLATFEPWSYIFNWRAYVDLSHNLISRFTNEMNFTLTEERAHTINLMYNNLTHIHQHNLSIYFNGVAPTALEIGLHLTLNVRNNPLVCDCSGHWLVDTFRKSLLTHYYETFTFFECATPPHLRGRSLDYLLSHGDEMVCNVTEGCPDGCQCVDTPHYRLVIITCHPALHNYTHLPSQLPTNGPLFLNLSRHALKELNVGKCNLSDLEILDVSNNQVQQLSTSFLSAAVNLRVLILRNNQLTTLPSDLQRLSLENLYLSGNRLQCSCDLLSFGKWVKAVSSNLSSVPSAIFPTDPMLLDSRYPLHDLSSRKDLSNAHLHIKTGPASDFSRQTPDALMLDCSLPDGRNIPVMATSEWDLECGSPLAVHTLVMSGVTLLFFMVGVGMCWHWRYHVRIFVNYSVSEAVCCCRRRREFEAVKAAEEGEVSVSRVGNSSQGVYVYDVYLSVNEDDTETVKWVTASLLPFLENRKGHNSLRVYLPVRQEPLGVSKAESRVEAIHVSRRVLVVLSNGYTDNAWCRLEFDHACCSLQADLHKNLVIVVRHVIIHKARKRNLDASVDDCNEQATDHKVDIRLDPVHTPRNVEGDKVEMLEFGDYVSENVVNKHHDAENHQEKRNINAEPKGGINNQNKTSPLFSSVCIPGDSQDDHVKIQKCGQSENVADVLQCDEIVRVGNLHGKANVVAEQKNKTSSINQNRNRTSSSVLLVRENANELILNGETENQEIKVNSAAQKINKRRCDHRRPHRGGNTDIIEMVTIATNQTDRDKRNRRGNSAGTIAEDVKEKRDLKKIHMRQMEQLSGYDEDGKIVALEPLRSFLTDGRYVSASDRLFKYKLHYELRL